MPKTKKLRARDVVIPIGLFILLVVVIIGTVGVGVQQGWKIPGIGSIGLSGGNGQTGSGQTGAYTYTTTGSNGAIFTVTGTTTNTGTGQTGTGQSIIPVGKVAFNMKLTADYTDGTNSTISSTGNLPGLDTIQIGGRSVKDVRAQTLIGFISATPLPASAIATITANVTLYNEKTQLAVWRTYEYTSGFVDSGTTALVLLPDFTVTAETVYSDVCSQLSNGTVTCNKVGGAAPASRRIDWNVQSTVTISGFQVIPQTFSGTAVSSADFGTAISGCVNCGGGGSPSTPSSPTLPSKINNDGSADFKPDPCPGCSSVKITTPTGGGPGAFGSPPTVGCFAVLPLFCTVASTGPGSQTGGKQTEKVTGKDGSTTDAKGGSTGGGATKSGFGGHAIAFSLLPNYYVPLDLGNGSWMFVNPWAAAVLALIYIAAAFAVIALVVLYRRL